MLWVLVVSVRLAVRAPRSVPDAEPVDRLVTA
jgi:hypothetical protein